MKSTLVPLTISDLVEYGTALAAPGVLRAPATAASTSSGDFAVTVMSGKMPPRSSDRALSSSASVPRPEAEKTEAMVHAAAITRMSTARPGAASISLRPSSMASRPRVRCRGRRERVKEWSAWPPRSASTALMRLARLATRAPTSQTMMPRPAAQARSIPGST